jgi:transcriptional regulator with XRE-family HTH domain
VTLPASVFGERTNPVKDFPRIVGEVLRQVRAGRGLSLHQVTVRSGGDFKPSSVASYERGERQISLARLFSLAEVYDVAPERIVAAIAYRLERERGEPEPGPEPVVITDPFAIRSRAARG